MAKETLLDSPRYKKFIDDRNKTLEKINQNTQVDVSRMLFEALEQIKLIAGHLCLTSHDTFLSSFHAAQDLEARSLQVFSGLIYPLTERIKRMRKNVTTLSYLAELEAIGQATQKKHTHISSAKHQLFTRQKEAIDSAVLTSGSLEERVWLALMKLRTKIISAYRLALTQKLDPKETLDRLEKAFPKLIAYKRPPRALKPLRESANKIPFSDKEEISLDFIDADDWAQMRDSYLATELPPGRFDNELILDDAYQTYDWELTQDMTDDFVKQVRDGESAAASDLGIEEFVWVAIIDDKTDDCCLERNGLTTKEIEDALESGELDADECDAVTVPAHPFCRCSLSPVASVTQVEGPDWKTFNDWLDT